MPLTMHGPLVRDPAWISACAGGQYDLGETKVVRGFPPEEIKYGYLKDCLQHNSLFAFFAKDFDIERSLKYLRESGEKQVKMFALDGHCTPIQSAKPTIPVANITTSAYNLTNIDKISSSLSLYSLLVKSGGNFTAGGRLPSKSYFNYTALFFKNIEEQINIQGPWAQELSSGGLHTRVEIDNLRCSVIRDGNTDENGNIRDSVIVEYDFLFRQWSFYFPGSPFFWDVKRRNTVAIDRYHIGDTPLVNLGANYPSGLPYVNPSYVLSVLSDPLYIERGPGQLAVPTAVEDYMAEGTQYYTGECTPLGISPCWGNSAVTDIDAMESALLGHLSVFSERVEDDLRNLVPATFYAAGKAVSDYVEILSANNLENLAQIGSTITILPEMVQLIKAVYTRKDLTKLLDAGISFLDVASQVLLTWNYGVAPAISDVQEFGEEWDNLVARQVSGGIYGRKTLYGRFEVTLPEIAYGYDFPHVTAQSKPVMVFDSTVLLGALLSLKAVGLEPSLNNAWDLVLGSFIIDWFARIGDKLEAVDNQVMLLLIPHLMTTDSILVKDRIPSDILEDLGIQLETESAVMRYYYRWISIFLPSLRESKYDFLPPSGPPVHLAGALAWSSSK